MTQYHAVIGGGVGAISIASANLRLRSGSDSYAQISMPFDPDFIDALTAALPTTLSVFRDSAELAEVDIDSVRADIGSSRKSITISGHAVISFPTPPSVTVTGVSYQTLENRYRIPVNPDIQPGSEVTMPDSTFTVGYISITVNSSTETMEITE